MKLYEKKKVLRRMKFDRNAKDVLKSLGNFVSAEPQVLQATANLKNSSKRSINWKEE